MNITDVKISKLSGEEKCKALASITIEGSFVVTGIRIIESQNGLFCAMPSRKTANGEYKDICFPRTAEARNNIVNAILEKYNGTDDELPF